MSNTVLSTTSFVPRLVGAALALAVAGIHIADQGGFPGSEAPDYKQVGFYLLEGVSVLTAAALLLALRPEINRAAWTLAAVFVAAAPLLGYALSRGPGLPGFDDDRGNWTEPLGVASLVVESALLALSVAALAVAHRARSQRPGTREPDARLTRQL